MWTILGTGYSDCSGSSCAQYEGKYANKAELQDLTTISEALLYGVSV